MCGDMTVRVGVLAMACDPNGLHLVNGSEGEWISGNVPAAGDVHWEVEYTLARHGIPKESILLLHSMNAREPGAFSTSWHPDDTAVVLTYVAAVRQPADLYVPEVWPDALPITIALFEQYGRPDEYDPTEPPIPNELTVSFHALRHLNNLVQTDTRNAEALPPLWHDKLAPWPEVLYTMFHRRQSAVAT